MEPKSFDRKNKKVLILHILINYKNKNGFSPTYREIAELSGIKSTSTVSSLLKEMEQDGVIRINNKVARSIVIL